MVVGRLTVVAIIWFGGGLLVDVELTAWWRLYSLFCLGGVFLVVSPLVV